MKQSTIFFVLVLLLAACGKDKFETKPQLKVKSITPKEVAQNQPLNIMLEFTDKEGDVSDSFFIIRQRLNIHDPVTKDPLPFAIPSFPNTQKGEFEINMDYFRDLTLQLDPIRIPGSNPEQNEPDTLVLKFVAKDKGGNYSDTATTGNIIVERL